MNPTFNPYPDENYAKIRRLMRQTADHHNTLSDKDPPTDFNSNQETKCGFSSIRVLGTVVVLLMFISVIFSLSVVLRDPPSDAANDGSDMWIPQWNSDLVDSKDRDLHTAIQPEDKLLSGLLSAKHGVGSCLSRYNSVSYQHKLAFEPSSYLIAQLRRYEDLHKRCGVYTESYNKTLEWLRSNGSSSSSDCRYLIWISFSGLGNRILTLASAFLYSLLTNRVLLVDPGTDMTDLFCEPFPEVSWFLPQDFPFKEKFSNFNQNSSDCYGKIMKNSMRTDSSGVILPSVVYLHLVHDYDDDDKLFFCDQDQALLQQSPWLVMKTDNYFVPSLFLMSSFEKELNDLFPNKDTVFHFLGRYLFHPTNSVWGLITRYYQAYLARASERIGIQIRVFDTGTGPFQHILDQVLTCTLKENLLPRTDRQTNMTGPVSNPKSKAVLITSLSAGYMEKLRDIYWENPTVTGERISFYQPSHEEHQQTEKSIHNQKALAEMYLLSTTDVLVTSSWSTFGYVAQGLGGLKPWILYKPENRTAPDPPCGQAMSMEPCFHAPPFYDCKAKKGVDTGKLVPHVKHCEDMPWGIKLVDRYD
ncbi:galactoside 2-alpha-L-fucosyltransferase-like isoform X1 [Cucurbita moschata]|uniref:Fucosyltransferase n=2 Tax=Cucurbita moschata TaxID=3662 RepID=A0A6J1GC66_CUCMO|nr:galactoside 2-alpha-L-fucosyltransferase-like isoform X1 [Cucurbita moschata]